MLFTATLRRTIQLLSDVFHRVHALLLPVLQIRYVYPGSQIRIFPSRILGQKDSGSRNSKTSTYPPCFQLTISVEGNRV